jgi:2,4-dienoyl-CoA reductase-like NADH-dependent reductase (Old Yellow Enzyme family)
MVLVSSLVVAEGTFISLHGAEWPFAPVMYSQSHAQAWKKVTDAVHKEGGKIFFQPWHPGGYFSDCNGGMISSLIQNGTTGRIQNESGWLTIIR